MTKLSVETMSLLEDIFAEFDAEDMVIENPDAAAQELLKQVLVYVKDPSLGGVVHPVVGCVCATIKYKYAHDAYKKTAEKKDIIPRYSRYM